jgi:hypothetical protein
MDYRLAVKAQERECVKDLGLSSGSASLAMVHRHIEAPQALLVPHPMPDGPQVVFNPDQ